MVVWSAGAVASLGGRIFRHGGGGASSVSRAAPSALVAFGGHTRATTAQRTLISVVPRSAPAAPAAAFVRSASTLSTASASGGLVGMANSSRGASRSKGIELVAAAAAALAFGGNAIDTPAFCSDADSDTNADAADEPPTEEDIDALIRDTNQVRAESANNDAEAAALGVSVDPPTVPPPDACLLPRTTEQIFSEYKNGPSIEEIERIAEEACGDLAEAKEELIESIDNLQTALEQHWLENPGDKERSRPSNFGCDKYSIAKRGTDLGGRTIESLAYEFRLHGLCDIIYKELLHRGYTKDNRKEDLTKKAATAIANNMLKFDNDTWPYYSNGSRSIGAVNQQSQQSKTRRKYRAMIQYIFEHYICKGCKLLHPDDFPRYGIEDDPLEQHSFNEALCSMVKVWRVEISGQTIFCPPYYMNGINAGTHKDVLAGLCLSQHLNSLRSHPKSTIPPHWMVELNALGFTMSHDDSQRRFLQAIGKSNEYTDSHNSQFWNPEWVRYRHALNFTGRDDSGTPVVPQVMELLSTEELRATLKTTAKYFLRSIQGIPFKINGHQIDSSFVKEGHDKPWTIDFRAEGEAACAGIDELPPCRYASQGDIRVTEIDDIERRSDRGLNEPPPSKMLESSFMQKWADGDFQRLCLDCHRSKSNLEQSTIGGFAPSYLFVDGARQKTHQKILQLISDYKLAWKCCPACGDDFDPNRPDLIDLHHPGELHGIYDASGKCLVLGKVHTVSKMPYHLTDDICIALLPHEIVKTVPLCCGCHRVVTHYASERYLEYYASNGVNCENPQVCVVPFGIGEVQICEDGSLRGPATA